MSLIEKIAYIKGLCEGLGLDANAKETKVIMAMIDLLDDMAGTVEAIDEDVNQLYDEIDAIDADLDDIEEVLFDEDYDCDCDDCDDDCDCGCGHDHHHGDDDDDMYEFTCPACGDTLIVDEETLFNSNFACPACGLKFDEILDSLEDEEEDEE